MPKAFLGARRPDPKSHLWPAVSAAPGIVLPAAAQPIYRSSGGETMAELVAAVPALLAADQAGQHYADAVRTAVAACAEDTAGQTCYICLDGGEEGLVRRCSCRGANGFVHVSCLVRAAQVAIESHRRWSLARRRGQSGGAL